MDMKRSLTTCGKLCGILVLASLALANAACAATPDAGLAGIWQGAIIFQRGMIEGDMVVKLSAGGDGKLDGLCSLPVLGVKDHPITDVKTNGKQLSFVYTDNTGSSVVNVSLAADGQRLDGEMVEKDKHYPVSLKRTTAKEMAPSGTLQVLSKDAHELHQRFDQDAGKVRLVIFVSPTCHNCVRMVRMVQRYLLEAVSDPRLAVYVVWGPMLDGDSAEAARQAMVHLTDPRGVHFWAPSADLAQEFSQPLHSERPAWDVVFFFAPGAQWSDPPRPADYVHTLGKQLPLDHQFDATQLQGKFEKLAAGK